MKTTSFYILFVILTLIAVQVVKPVMHAQSPMITLVTSHLTLNFVLFLGLWGWLTDRIAKRRKWNKRKSIAFCLISTLLLFVFLRLGGMETIFG